MMSIHNDNSFIYSKHAKTRMLQRGIKQKIIDFILHYGSQSWAGGGCEEYSVSRKNSCKLDAVEYDKNTISAATKVRVIVSSEGIVVTCYFKHNNRSFRSRYRRSVNIMTCHK